MSIPSETADLKIFISVCAIEKVFCFDNVNDWNENTCWLFIYSAKKRLKPVNNTFLLLWLKKREK